MSIRPQPERTISGSWIVLAATLLLIGVSVPAALAKGGLSGSRSSMDQQNAQARRHDFTYLRTPAQVRKFVDLGLLIPVRSNETYRLHRVSFPYARAEVRTFLERLSYQYWYACGETLVVTSLTRPRSEQPWNASDRSVHPTGMAIDLRRSSDSRCRGWLERVLVSLERQGVLEATRESNPPHYHVALFPEPYAAYVTALREMRVATTHRVAPGETLWSIARSHGVAVEQLRWLNRLPDDGIRTGQLLEIPAPGTLSLPTRR